MNIMFPRFLENVNRFRLVNAGDTLIAGFSGGKDSVTLLVLLGELQRLLPIRLLAAYFNHRLRPDAAAEEEWVRRFCRKRGLEIQVGSRDVRRFQKEESLNLEHAAAVSRYDFFHQLAAEFPGGAKIVTGHSRSDLAETFLIKLFRGSGLQGLSAIYASKNREIIRPLLIFSQEEIKNFLTRNHITYYSDPSNRDPGFLRNRIRLSLLPEIKKIEPEIEERILKTVSLIQEEYAYFREESERFLAKRLLLNAILPLAELRRLPQALQRHVVREYLRRLKGNLLNIGLEHIDGCLDIDDAARGLSLPGLTLRREKGFLFPEGLVVPGYRLLIPGPGNHRLEEIGKEIIIKEAAAWRRPAAPGGNRQAMVPASALTFPLTARPSRKEDRYQKINSPYRQSVFEMIRSSGTPAALRNLCPVLENGDGRIIWVWGSPVSEEFRCLSGQCGPFFRVSLK